MMESYTRLIDTLKRDEGRVVMNDRHVPYDDHLGFSTIGYGRLIDERRGGGLDENEAEYLLKNDVNRIIQQIGRMDFADNLDQVRKAVLVMMAFQLGMSGMLGFKKMLEGVKSRDYGKAAAEMLKSRWAEQTPARAKRLAIMMDTGAWA